MTNKEKYQRTFSVLHASEFDLEETAMNKRKGIRISKRVTAVCAAAAIVAAMSIGAYATDIGGIQKKVNIWLNGEQTEAVVDIKQSEDMTEYELKYTDESGEEKEIHGGGVAMDGFGRQRALTEEELMEHIGSAQPTLDHGDDGSVWVYYKDYKENITDKLDENGCGKCELEFDDAFIYIEIDPNGDETISTTPMN